jgi:hypothetical protein
MVKILQESNMKKFEDELNEWMESGYEIFEIKITVSPSGHGCSWIAILKKDI